MAIKYGAPGLNAARPSVLRIIFRGKTIFTKQLQGDGTMKTLEYRVAGNDVPGKYQVELFDILSSKTTVAEFIVQP